MKSIVSCQHGIALISLLTLLVLASAGFAYTLYQPAPGIQQQQRQQTIHALEQARQALLGYALSYGETHHKMANGFLPCPDLNGQNGNGSSNPVCGSQNLNQLGRYPWRSLGQTILRDAHGNCLWYVVSGRFKNNPKTDLLNWDTRSYLSLTYADQPGEHSEIIAAIIAPGPPLQQQQRSSQQRPCRDDYRPAHYLDQGHGFQNPTPHASVNQTQRLTSINLNQLQRQQFLNDYIVTIRRDQLFNLLIQRPAFISFINQLLQDSVSCLNTLPAPATLTFHEDKVEQTSGGRYQGQLEQGRVPASCLSAAQQHWQDQLLYARCTDASACVTVDATKACRGVVIFAGRRNTSQQRNTASQRNQWHNYLEPPRLTAFRQGLTHYQSNTGFNPAHAEKDMLRCIL